MIKPDILEIASFNILPCLLFSVSAQSFYQELSMLKKFIHSSFVLGIEKHDKEGRAITAEYEDFFLVTSCECNLI